MLGIIIGVVWVVTAIGVVLLLAALVGRFPTKGAFALVALAELAALVAVVADVGLLVGGFRTPALATHISYLLTVPFIIPAGLALTYKKIDRWGLLILGVATLIAAIMVVRQVQTLGIAYGYLNLGPAGG